MTETMFRTGQSSASHEAREHGEGAMARAIEYHTAKLPRTSSSGGRSAQSASR